MFGVAIQRLVRHDTSSQAAIAGGQTVKIMSHYYVISMREVKW